jgi:predicted NBD/HSP70 family sugar kinase
MDVLHGGPASRAAISRATGLSKPTVSAVMRDLEDADIIRQLGTSIGRVGRSSTLYEVNRTAAFALGMDVGGSKIVAGITDLFGATRAERTESTRRDHGSDLLTQVADIFGRLVAESGIERTHVRAAGISIPGVIHPESDQVTRAFNVPALSEMHPHRDFSAALGIPVVIANDANLAAAGEQWRGSALDSTDFVALFIGNGIGLGIVMDGAIYLGAHGAAGEIGQLPLAPGPVDPAWTIGGPFEDTASGPAVMSRLRALRSGRAAGQVPETVAELFDAASAGESVAVELIEEEARLLAFGIATVVAIVDPARVVLGGSFGAHPGLLEPVRRHLAAMVPQAPEVVTSSLGDRASFYGSVAVALNAAREQLLRDVRKNGLAGDDGAEVTAPGEGRLIHGHRASQWVRR